MLWSRLTPELMRTQQAASQQYVSMRDGTLLLRMSALFSDMRIRSSVSFTISHVGLKKTRIVVSHEQVENNKYSIRLWSGRCRVHLLCLSTQFLKHSCSYMHHGINHLKLLLQLPVEYNSEPAHDYQYLPVLALFDSWKHRSFIQICFFSRLYDDWTDQSRRGRRPTFW